MTEKKQKREPEQETAKGYVIRVPKRREFMDSLKKVAKTDSATKDRSKQ